jgi:hypothetical protein
MITLIRSGFILQLMLLVSGCGWNGTPTRTNDFVPLTSIQIVAELPTIEVSKTIAAQTSTKLKVNGNFSGLFTHDVTDQVVWSSDSPLVASFPYATSPNKNRVKGGIAGTAIITAKVGGVSATYTLTVSSATIDTLTITPDASLLAPLPKGRTIQFAANGKFSDSTTQDMTFDAAWISSNPAVASVSDVDGSRGLAKAEAAVGTATISATFGSAPTTATANTTLTVTDPVVESISVLPANPSVLSLSTTDSFTATGTYSDGSTKNITDQVNWASSNTGIATIAATGGAAKTLLQGTTSISATPLPSVPSDPGVSGATSLRVTGGNLTSFTVSPTVVTLVNDTTVRMTATGTFVNGSASVTRDITGAVQWTTPPNTSFANVSAAEGNLVMLKALATTTQPTTITATASTSTPFITTLTVIAPPLKSIAIFTTSPELTSTGPLTAGTSARFTVTAAFNDGTAQDVTTLCSWTSNNVNIATVGTSGLAAGRVTGGTAGSTSISATYTNNGITVSVPVPAPVTVKTRVLQSLTISPAASTVTAGQQVSYTAVASYLDGTTKDVTEDATWSIDNPNVAIQADKVNQPWQIVAVDRGLATITASFGGTGGKTQTATLTVTGP